MGNQQIFIFTFVYFVITRKKHRRNADVVGVGVVVAAAFDTAAVSKPLSCLLFSV